MNNIRSIIFDLGGVILNIDYLKTIKHFQALGFSNFESTFTQSKQSQIFDLFETGKIGEKEFFESLRADQKHISIADMKEAWNAMLLDLPQERWDFIQKLGDTMPIALLSNTNETHVRALAEQLPGHQALPKLQALFKNAYFSNEIGLRKPNRDVFEFVLNENGFQPETTLFIDDSLQHIEGAKKLGIQTWHLKNGESILDLSAKYL